MGYFKAIDDLELNNCCSLSPGMMCLVEYQTLSRDLTVAWITGKI